MWINTPINIRVCTPLPPCRWRVCPVNDKGRGIWVHGKHFLKAYWQCVHCGQRWPPWQLLGRQWGCISNECRAQDRPALPPSPCPKTAFFLQWLAFVDLIHNNVGFFNCNAFWHLPLLSWCTINDWNATASFLVKNFVFLFWEPFWLLDK